MARYCANCGTEVDDNAIFCPTCGQPIDQAAETEIPPAPAWPDAPREEAGVQRPEVESRAHEAPPPDDEPTRAEIRPDPPPAAAAARPSAAPAPRRPIDDRDGGAAPRINVPFTAPVTLSAWLIGGGSLLAAIGVIIGLFDVILNPIELLLLLALLVIAATVFFSSSVPNIPNLRLATLVVVLIGFGIALDRLSFGGGVGELLLFLGTAAAAMGAIILELGRDQPLGGPGR